MASVDIAAFELKAPIGKFAYRDSGPVPNKSQYTTVVLIHGMGFHSGSFAPSFAAAPEQSARLIVLNRRDFPQSVPYSDDEHAQLNKALESPPEAVRDFYVPFMKERSKEIVDFLVALIKKEGIPPVDESGTGGIVLSSWSLGAYWLMAFLKNIAALSASCDLDLKKYMQRVVVYDAPALTFGMPKPEDPYGPFGDDEIPPEKRYEAFSKWIGSYFDHASSPDGLERRKTLEHLPVTKATADPKLNSQVSSPQLTAPGGSDWAHLIIPQMSGVAEEDRNDILFGNVEAAAKEGETEKYWLSLPVRYVYCDHSIWESPWCVRKLNEQIEAEKERGRVTREVSVKTLEGANHFAHWDKPEQFLEAMLARA
ncbi:hypothetical protein CC79DRAFT_1367391 [Sarocladium strictum]